jgi:hypothetical protein
MKFTDLTAAYGQSHVLFVDNKYINTAPMRAEFWALLKTIPNWQSRIVYKYYYSNTTAAAEAKSQGFTTWGYYYEADIGNLASTQANWDLLGMEYGASAATWDTMLATGKPVIGHVINSSSAATAALSKGAAGLMVSAVTQVVPGPVVTP